MPTAESSLCDRLNGKRLVVTGGSRGIGAEIVRQATKVGAEVTFTYNRDAGQTEAECISSETGARYMRLKLGQPSSVEDFLNFLSDLSRDVHQGGGPQDYVIANAGMEFSGGLEEHTPWRIADVVNSNLIGNMLLMRGLVTKGIMRQGGQIAVIGSIAASGNHDQFAYSAAKAGLRGAVESLRYDKQVGEQELGIKLVEPGIVTEAGMAVEHMRAFDTFTMRHARAVNRDRKEFLAEFHQRCTISAANLAKEVLALTACPSAKGVRTVPEGLDLHAMREGYFGITRY